MIRPEVDDLARRFVTGLEALEPADRARLRRNAGKELGEARGAVGLFYSLLPHDVPARHEESFFLVSTLYPLSRHVADGRDFGHALRRVRTPANAKGLDRRLERLLDADREQLSFRLRQALHYLSSQRGHVDVATLLVDLIAWNRIHRPVQRRWAASYHVGYDVDTPAIHSLQTSKE